MKIYQVLSCIAKLTDFTSKPKEEDLKIPAICTTKYPFSRSCKLLQLQMIDVEKTTNKREREI